MARLPPTPTTIKRLFAYSGNYCAMPDCSEMMIQENKVVGQICHIESANPKGHRYNKKQDDEERRSYENLILFCPKHHKLSDDEGKFPVDKLKEIKKTHELKFEEKQYEIHEDKFEKIYEQILKNLDEINEKLNLLPEIKSDTNTIKDQNNQILDLLINERLENSFDLKKHSADVVVSRFSQALKKINQTSDGYNINMSVSNDKTSIEIIDKNFDKMDKDGMLFQTKLKLTKQKSESLNNLLKNSKDGKIKFDASEIEQIVITKDDKPVYIVNGLTSAELAIKNEKPKPRMVKILIPNESGEYENVSLHGEKINEQVVFLSNKDQTYYPITIEFEIDRKTNQGKFHISTEGKSHDLVDEYEYLKFINKLYKRNKLHVVDQESNKILLDMDIHIDQEKKFDAYEELLHKLLVIQKKTNVVFPWPQEIIDGEQANIISAVFDVVTTGKTSTNIRSTLVSDKQDNGTKTFMKSLKKIGYSKGKFTIKAPHIFQIFGQTIDLGPFSVSGKITTDKPPNEVLKKYESLEDNEKFEYTIISLGGESIATYEKWS